MRSKECLLNAKKARSEAELSLNPHVKNAFLQIDRLYSRLAEIARVDECRVDAGVDTADSTPLPAFVLRTAQVRVAKSGIAKAKN
jgi:histidine ammonia-lyase